MAETMTPSAESKTTTAGQIDKAVANYRALLEKHSKELNSESVQLVLGQSELADEQFAVFRRRVEAISDIIWREVIVNRGETPQEALDATGRVQYTNSEVVKTMPRGEGEKVRVGFFKLNRWVSDDDLEREYELRGLKSDPYAQMAVNKADPAFADIRPNGCHWKGPDGRWHYIAFRRWHDGERSVDCSRREDGWDVSWWFAGVSK